MVKHCCFRFDADTHACVSLGLPRLVALGDELGVRFTFFVNMGRAFDPRITLAKAIARRRTGGRRQALPVLGKLGWRAALTAAVLNPRAGYSDPEALRAAARAGHEIGLHGGRNHARWERFAHTWNEDRLQREIRTGLRWMEECGLPAPCAFASPAWNSPPALRPVLSAHGIRILADTYDGAAQDIAALGPLLAVPTNIVAAVGSAGYLEAARLLQWTKPRIIDDFRAQLRRQPKLAVVYDHPFFSGVHALEEIAALVRVAREEGFQISSLSAAAQSLAADHGARGQSKTPAACALCI